MTDSGNFHVIQSFEQWSFDSGYSIFPVEDATEVDGSNREIEVHLNDNDYDYCSFVNY